MPHFEHDERFGRGRRDWMEGRVSRFRTYLEPTLLLPIPMPMGAFVFEMVVLHKYLSYFGLVRNRREFVSVHQIELLPMGKQYQKKYPENSVRFLDRFVSHVAALAGSGQTTTASRVQVGNLPSGQKCR